LFTHNPVEIPQLKRKNTENGRRYETPTGALYPSITTILSAKSKPFIDAWKNKIGHAEANRISSKAAKRGTSIHSLVEHHLNNEKDLHEQGVQSLDMMTQEMYNNNMMPLLSDIDNIRCLESFLYSDHLRLGGQVDCIAEYKGVLSIIDFKTSNKRKTRSQCYNYFIQCAAYAIMFEERTGIPVSQTVILMAQQDDGPAVFTAKRDDFVTQLLDARDDYELAQL
jgi:ATP-dependent exoDNAse (exonuclease V) beta subunit